MLIVICIYALQTETLVISCYCGHHIFFWLYLLVLAKYLTDIEVISYHCIVYHESTGHYKYLEDQTMFKEIINYLKTADPCLEIILHPYKYLLTVCHGVEFASQRCCEESALIVWPQSYLEYIQTTKADRNRIWEIQLLLSDLNQDTPKWSVWPFGIDSRCLYRFNASLLPSNGRCIELVQAEM